MVIGIKTSILLIVKLRLCSKIKLVFLTQGGYSEKLGM